ncbi:hypothetical protein F5Y17DRAFT_315159 [Xylariaceae sp. FL0594]|nr:hypothetical protein F5Y17DRAFT_315159 [Xylariaceae sp. FL0594]
MMRSLQRDYGSMAVKPVSTPTGTHGWNSGVSSRRTMAKGKAVATAVKPWADQPWLLIQTPSATQSVSHPALYIANDLAHIHNAMLRGLNAIYLQAPHVQLERDIADLLFLARAWSGWVLDHHERKEGVLLPSFEAVLGLAPGTLCSSRRNRGGEGNHSRDSSSSRGSARGPSNKNSTGSEEAVIVDDEVSLQLRRVHSYAAATLEDPRSYDAVTFEALLISLAELLVPHLTAQIGLLASMREMCYRVTPNHRYTKSGVSDTIMEDDDITTIPARLPIPMVTITRTSTAQNVLSSSSGSNTSSASADSSSNPSSGAPSPSESMSTSPASSPPLSPTFSAFSAASTSTSYFSLSSASASSPSGQSGRDHKSDDKNSDSNSSSTLSLFPPVPTTANKNTLDSINITTSTNNAVIQPSPTQDTHTHRRNAKGFFPTSILKSVSLSSKGKFLVPQPRAESVSPQIRKPDRSLELFQTATTTTTAKRPPHHNRPANTKTNTNAHPFYEADADARATRLMKTYQEAESRASTSTTMDRFVVLPMIVRLRDVTLSSSFLHTSSSNSSLTTSSTIKMTRGYGGNGMSGAGATDTWPRLSIPAVHAIADKLSPRHEGAWRFLPCDVWGRPRELPFSVSET